MDYHQHDPARSVLSPAAYFVELMDLIEKYISVDTSQPGAVLLKTRRQDLWDKVDLDAESTDTEIQKLDKVISVLENYLGSSEYIGLDSAKYPFNLPYDKNYQKLRTYVMQAGTSLSEIWGKFGDIACPQSDLDLAIWLDTMGISYRLWTFLSTSQQDDLNAIYGLDSSVTNPEAVLSSVDTFLAQSGLTAPQLNELLYQDLTSDEMSDSPSPQENFYINQGLTSAFVSTGNGVISNLTQGVLDRIRRFTGLAKALGWNYQDLDWALYSIQQAAGKQEVSISNSLGYLSWMVGLVQDGLTISEACAMVWQLRNYGTKNGPTPFDQVFSNPKISNPPDWPSSSVTWYTSYSSVPSGDTNQSTLQSALGVALGLSHSELQQLGQLLGDSVVLDDAGLAQLYQLSLLPKITGLTVAEIVLAMTMIPTVDGKSMQALLQSGVLNNRVLLVQQLQAFAKSSAKLPVTISMLAFIVSGNSNDPSVSHLVPKGNELENWKTETQKGLENAGGHQGRAEHFIKTQISGLLQVPNIGKSVQAWGEAYLKSEDGNPASFSWVESFTAALSDSGKIVDLLTFLQRINFLIQNFGLSETESQYFLGVLGSSIKLKTDFVESIRDYRHLTQTFSDQQNTLLDLLQSSASLTDASSLSGFVELTGWSESSLNQLIGSDASLAQVTIANTLLLLRFFELESGLGLDTTGTWSLMKPTAFSDEVCDQLAQAVFGGLQARLGTDAAVLNTLQNTLKKQYRDRLVGLSMHQLGIDNVRDLFNYFLIDTQVSGVPVTSTVREAISAAQLYIQRCLNHLEPGISFNTTDSPSMATLWKWMSTYSHWEANKEVFIFPENYLQPELRSNCSPEFSNLITHIRSVDRTSPGAFDNAYKRFFADVFKVTKVKILAVASMELELNPGNLEFFLIGMSDADPREYYYQIARGEREKVLSDNSNPTETIGNLKWGYWQKIHGLDPVIFENGYPCFSPKKVFGKWHLFWLEQQIDTSGTNSSTDANPTATTSNNKRQYKVSCCYTILGADGNWSAKQEGSHMVSGDLTTVNLQIRHYISFQSVTQSNDQSQIQVSYQYLGQSADQPDNYTRTSEHFVLTSQVNTKSSSSVIWTITSGGDEQDTRFSLEEQSAPSRSYLPQQSAFMSSLDLSIHQTSGVDEMFAMAGGDSWPNPTQDLIGNQIFSNYYWELLFHGPFLIAHELQTHENFELAKKWYEYIFCPQVVGSTETGKDRFWKFQGLKEAINAQLSAELALSSSEEKLSDLASRAQLSVSDTDPFDPQAIAWTRPLGYQKTLFMHYFRNLLDWGDSLMMRNTRESINEAELTYVMAADLLGAKPADLGAAEDRPSLLFQDMRTQWKIWSDSSANIQRAGVSTLKFLEGELLLLLGDLWMSNDGGGTWTQQITSQQLGGKSYDLSSCSEVHVFQGDFYAVGSKGELWQYSSGSWALMTDPSNSSEAFMIQFISVGEVGNGQEGLIVMDKNGIMQYIGGQSWTTVASGIPDNPGAMICVNGFLYVTSYVATLGKNACWVAVLQPGSIAPFSRDGLFNNFNPKAFKIDGNYLFLLGDGKCCYTQIGSIENPSWTKPLNLKGKHFFITDNIWCQRVPSGPIWSADQGASWNVASISGNPVFQNSKPMPLFQSNNTLYFQAGSGDSNVLYKSVNGGVDWAAVTIESGNNTLDLKDFQWIGGDDGTIVVATNDALWTASPSQYFSVPQNLQLLSYWDEINQRLYDIDHGLNLNGELDILPLFTSEYGVQNPNALALSASALEQLVGSDLTTIPHYRFSYMVEKAKEACADLRSLGAALLSALENTDAAALSKLYLQQEQSIMQRQQMIKEDGVLSSQQSLDTLNTTKQGVKNRISHFQNLIDKGLLANEQAQLANKSISMIMLIVKEVFDAISIYNYILPTIVGTADGGSHPGDTAKAWADVFGNTADIMGTATEIAALNAEHERRSEDWQHDLSSAEDDNDQIDNEIAVAKTTVKIAQKELEIMYTQIQQKQKVAQFMLQKFTNEQLYQWYVTQLKTLYYQSYQMAMEYAVMAENCRKFEQNLTSNATSYITDSYWNNLQDGLLAGEKLHQDLLSMEKHYIENNARPLFIEKPISLRSFDPISFVTLITTGTCSFNVTERDYDFAFPGHYNRRISRVSVFVELQDGVSGHVNATLTQLSNKVVTMDDSTNGVNAIKYLLNGTKLSTNNPAYISDVSSGQSVIMSQGPSDPEMLIINSNDSRYLPFEGSGAISTWQLDMPKDSNAMDLARIKDIKIHLYYTAYEGIGTFKQAVIEARGSFKGSVSMALATQHADAWSAFIDQTQPKALKWLVDPSQWRANGNAYTIEGIKVLAIGEEGTTLPQVTLSIPQTADANTVNLTPKINSTVEGNVPSGGIALDLINTQWQLSATTGSGSGKKETKVPTGLKELLLFIDYSISFPAS